MEERYISVAEVAEQFSVSTTLIYRLIKDGVIPAVRIGYRNYRISPDTVEELKKGGLFE